MKTYFKLCSIPAVMMLAACGGGGGGGGGSSDTANNLPETPETQGYASVSVQLAEEADNPTAAEVLSYLRTHISGGPWKSGPGPNAFTFPEPDRIEPGLGTFKSIPTVRIANNTSSRERAMVHHAIALVNRELPYNLHIQVGSDASPLTPIRDIPEGQIFVDFALPENWEGGTGRPGSEAVAQVDPHKVLNPRTQLWERQYMRAARVWMSPATWFQSNGRSEGNMMWILVHEILHTLGLHGHVLESEHPDAVLTNGYQRNRIERVPEIEGSALRVAYMRLAPDTLPADLTLTSLGPWETTSSNLMGEIGVGGSTVRFGVEHRNGVSVPWTSGRDPSMALAENRSLTGTLTWSGGLLGLTPNGQSVGGDAEIHVNMATMTGSADFASLRSWAAGQTPGALETGVQWEDGSLSYSISVSGNFLRNTGGDAGALAGNFYGSGHEGVAGSLERSDLTAAFGAKRR